MAAAGGIPLIDPGFDIDEANYIGKFVYDVMMYTLPRCGFHIPIFTRNCPNIIYSRPNFVNIVGLSTLRLCLVMRDTWRETLQSLPRKRDTVYNIYYFAGFFSIIVKLAEEEGDEAKQLNIEMSLALCNEMILYFFSENIAFNFTDLVSAATSNIFSLILPPREVLRNPKAPHPIFSAELQKLFPEIGNVWELSRWFENFVQRHAVPYDSRMNVTKVFYREVKKRWVEIVEKENSPEGPSIEKVKINLGFLPQEVYDDIVSETSVPMPPYSKVAWALLSLKKSKTFETAKPSASSEKRPARGGRPYRGKSGQSSKYSSKQVSEGGQSSKDSSKQVSEGGQKSEDSSGQAAKGCQKSKDSSKKTTKGEQSSKDSKKTTKGEQSSKDSKKTTKGEQSSKDSSKQVSEGGQSSKDSSKQVSEGGQKSEDSSGQAAKGCQKSKDSSKKATKGEQSSKDSSKQAVEEESIDELIKRLGLEDEGSSKAGKGAISKRKDKKK